ncbi:MAG TPA: hypothetical protein VH559_14110, partial [Gemmatimonadaceae bacterium]
MRYPLAIRIALCTVASVPGWSGPAGSRPASVADERCDASIASYERMWHGTGEWQRLAPFPIARDASPTDSIGVWLERSRADDGSLELRRVSAGETLVAQASGASCEVQLTHHRRTFNGNETSAAFTDDDLRTLVRQNTSGMIYVWSPGMPLSIRGLDEARAAARTLGIAFTAVVADATPAELRAVDASIARSMSSVELLYRNATIHYPSITFYQNGALLGSAIPGYKQRDTYVTLAREAFARPTQPPPSTTPPNFWVDHTARVSTTRTVQTVRRVGFFFKPIATTDYVSYTSDNAAFLFNLGTRQEQRIPGTVDPVPTPDGRMLTRPGLTLYPMSFLIAGDTTPSFVDRELPDEYQTASILKHSKNVTRYRIVTGWRMGARYRDYDVTFGRDGRLITVKPLGAPFVPCAERTFSLPISAKGSKEIGVYDTRSRTNHIINVTDDGGCTDVLDLGFASGKLAFSYDGSAIAFATSRINTDAEGEFLKPEENFYKDALILYRKTGRVVSLTTNRPLSSMTFPEFLPDGRVM